jgi:thioesterase domain-containing protein
MSVSAPGTTSIPPDARTAMFWRLVSWNAASIVPFGDEGPGARFYCVHPVSGDVTSFGELAAALGPACRFYGLQVPRRRMEAAIATSIETLARHHAGNVMRFQPDGPIMLGGWSAGAIVALEMAQQLAKAGRDVPLLVAFDGGPCNTGAGIRPGTPRYAWRLARNAPAWLQCELREAGGILALATRLFRKAMFRRRVALPARRADQTLHRGAVEDMLGASHSLDAQMAFIRALYAAMHRYVPRPYAGRVIVYEAKAQPLDHLLQIGAAWHSIAPDAEVVELEGNHGLIFREPAVSVVAQHLRARLGEIACPGGAA